MGIQANGRWVQVGLPGRFSGFEDCGVGGEFTMPASSLPRVKVTSMSELLCQEG